MFVNSNAREDLSFCNSIRVIPHKLKVVKFCTTKYSQKFQQHILRTQILFWLLNKFPHIYRTRGYANVFIKGN